MMGTPKLTGLVIGAALLLEFGCPAPVDDDATSTTTSTSTNADTEGTESASSSASGTSATAQTDPTTGSETALTDPTTGVVPCDPDTCESLDLEACQACPDGTLNDSCTVLYGWLWTEDQGEWCTEQSVPLGCKPNGICFDYDPTACDGKGQMYYLDNVCPEIDFATLGLALCDPPSDAQAMCPG